jgi:hypothetical protein
VNERRELMDTLALTNFTPQDLELLISRRRIDEGTRAALQRLLDIKTRIAALDARLSANEAEATEIAADQNRLRENIRALGQTPEARQLIARYVARAGEQETRLEQISTERRTVSAERERAQVELDAAIRALALDRRITQ